MYEEITEILDLWVIAVNRTPELIEKVKKYYRLVSGKDAGDCVKCQSKWINELQKWQHRQQTLIVPYSERQYVLKPGDHAFIPGPAQFNNENTDDAACRFYLRLYPHIRSLFIKIPS